jgi:hypothetical protein
MQCQLPDFIPDFLSHYYDAATGPFVNLSDMPVKTAEMHLERIRQAGKTFASQRSADYLTIRRELEERVREQFLQKGGRPLRERPHYMILGSCKWLLSWYERGCELRIPLKQFLPEIVSFTYGDTFPAMRSNDGKLHRGKVYCLNELESLVLQFGLPQRCNVDGKHGPDRYIEAQIWDDAPLHKYTISEG